jgi:SpoVK/Ycf46/Vps4 family AAA+-type ATPase
MIHGRKPIMSPALEKQVMNAVVMFSKRALWKKWGMHTVRKQGAAILLKGPPGCGKTRIAEYLALNIRRKGIKELLFADFGSHVPGENSRQIRRIFSDAEENGGMTIFLDECEAVLWDRSKAGSTAMWMLEVIDELLAQIGKYKHLTILATNKDELLDSALYRRLLAVIHVGFPEKTERIKLWQQKLPHEFPLKLSIEMFNEIATLQLSGAEIETAIIDVASDCIRRDIKLPKFEMLFAMATQIMEERERHERARELQNETTKV